MHVDVDGLTVRAPRWVSVREIEAVLAERSGWILRALESWATRRRDVLPRTWETGAPLLYRGRQLALALFPARETSIQVDLFDLTVRHPLPGDPDRVELDVRRWFRSETERTIVPRVAHFASQLALPAPPVKLSNAAGEWGSCSQRGVVRLNWRLAHLPPELADYVVAHEVAHLVELNHSARFWALVAQLEPAFKARRRELREWTAVLAA